MKKEDYMALALSLASGTIGQTSPNPSVGAVVVKNGRIVGLGSHLKSGGLHAEVYALIQAGAETKGADVYVTLEPCAHVGKTPPCAQLLIDRQVSRVFIAMADPNPQVAGKGINQLQQAGIHVEVGLGAEEAAKLNEPFFHYLKYKRPFVILKAAMTMDGKVATQTGDSCWVTSAEAREDVHNERAKYDAILVGSKTVATDNPHLTVRQPQNGKNPIRIVLATHLEIKGDRHILNNAAPTWLICGSQADVELFRGKYPHIKVIQLKSKEIEINTLLDALGNHGVQSVYVEGGSQILTSFIQANAFQVCHWYIAPKLLTGQDAIAVTGGKSPLKMKDGYQLVFEAVEQVGRDIKLIARPIKGVE
ncbi:diaminohydroxyphosphoribosylaminopyrimidine deaminase [Amphibacillus marinus]|uniref:Riboflavin biosynthesis protein RibD n=1 Tax=Amphibacillus marinus TaxID=872970 RepID=A0A1H8JTU4_9BACI|nr:bifunctional diaminohydroxyphosphoribosylaminopyrimidine deaminase/5-amino-6-(5-phosphoribosylamino)uracil reductase RibD [Amphibacillus marinus]SEN84173.1 diaminohydroxyphosphoribosylaminopyrimidine deaminase [Amphibacillus marinus]